MKTIAIINQKGGVGKSTTALAIGAGLTLKGYSVLYTDLDAQGNLSYTLGANTQGYNAMGVLQRPETAKEEIQHTPQGDIIASSPAPEGYKVNPLYIETKSKRLQLLVQPSLLDKLKGRAKAEGRSVNDLVHSILEEALREEN